jgi:hypothetical protein
MGIDVNINGTNKQMDKGFVNINGVWKNIDKAFCNVSGSWKEGYSGHILGYYTLNYNGDYNVPFTLTKYTESHQIVWSKSLKCACFTVDDDGMLYLGMLNNTVKKMSPNGEIVNNNFFSARGQINIESRMFVDLNKNIFTSHISDGLKYIYMRNKEGSLVMWKRTDTQANIISSTKLGDNFAYYSESDKLKKIHVDTSDPYTINNIVWERSAKDANFYPSPNGTVCAVDTGIPYSGQTYVHQARTYDTNGNVVNTVKVYGRHTNLNYGTSCIDSKGNFYYYNHTVYPYRSLVKYSASSQRIWSIDLQSILNNDSWLNRVDVDVNGTVYLEMTISVGEYSNYGVFILNSNGVFVKRYGPYRDCSKIELAEGLYGKYK